MFPSVAPVRRSGSTARHNAKSRAVGTKDEQRVLHMLFARNNLNKARTVFTNYIRIRPRDRITIPQRTWVLDQWPRHGG
jgi:hypothetical protein